MSPGSPSYPPVLPLLVRMIRIRRDDGTDDGSPRRGRFTPEPNPDEDQYQGASRPEAVDQPLLEYSENTGARFKEVRSRPKTLEYEEEEDLASEEDNVSASPPKMGSYQDLVNHGKSRDTPRPRQNNVHKI